MNEHIARLWSFARYTLRLTSAEFGELTPREFQMLADQHEAEALRADRRAALVCMVLANCHRNPDKKPEAFTVADFMPRDPDAPVREQTWEHQKSIFGAIAAAVKQGAN